MLFIVRLFPEITIKSLPVRKRWTKILTANLRVLARQVHPKSKVIEDWDRILVRLDDDRYSSSDAAELSRQYSQMLKRIPGIANFSRVSESRFTCIEDICERAVSSWSDSVAGLTFCVRGRRIGKHDFDSMQVERTIGSKLMLEGKAKGVNLKAPDITLNLEIKKELCYIVESKVEGLGGFPMGTQEAVLSLVSGGFDSTLASFMMMQRGMRTHFCFFNMGGREHELAVKELAFYLWTQYASTHRVRFITVPFEAVVENIVENVDAANMGVVLKRMMMRAAEKVAIKGKIQALVTGEAIAQVSSQTLNNLRIIDKVTDQLILRPLITMSKTEIISRCRDIGAEEFSAAIPEYCGAVSVKPSAKVKLHDVEAQEKLCDPKVFDDALEACIVQSIDDVVEPGEQANDIAVEVVSELSEGDCIIDIRHPDEVALRKIHLGDRSVVSRDDVKEIPFYQLNNCLDQLIDSKVKRYLLYCDRGIMSQLHALHLRDSGQSRVAVYRPQLARVDGGGNS